MLSLNISTLFALIILTILFILSQGQEQDESFDENKKFYILGDFDNFYCNSTKYISSFTGIMCTNQIISSNKNFSFSFKDTKSQSHKVKCDINYKSIIRNLAEDYSYYSDYESMDSDFPSPDEKNCFKTLCEFDGMIKEQFQFIINEDEEENEEDEEEIKFNEIMKKKKKNNTVTREQFKKFYAEKK